MNVDQSAPDEDALRARDGTICVGVDGSQASQRAVLWGAVEARLRQAPLLLVHVELVATDSLGANASEISGELLLALGAKAAVELEPEIDVRTELITGSSVRAGLVELTRRCTVLALGIDLTRSRATHGARGPI